MYPYISGKQKQLRELFAKRQDDNESYPVDDEFTDHYEDISGMDDNAKLFFQELQGQRHDHNPGQRPEPHPGHKPEPHPHHKPEPHPSHKPEPHPTLPPGPYPGPRDTWSKPPTYRPPAFIPRQDRNIQYVDPVSMKRCEGNLVYIWFKDGHSGWLYLTRVGRGTVTGYSWTALGWAYTGFDVNSVEGFYCFG